MRGKRGDLDRTVLGYRHFGGPRTSSNTRRADVTAICVTSDTLSLPRFSLQPRPWGTGPAEGFSDARFAQAYTVHVHADVVFKATTRLRERTRVAGAGNLSKPEDLPALVHTTVRLAEFLARRP